MREKVNNKKKLMRDTGILGNTTCWTKISGTLLMFKISRPVELKDDELMTIST